jgi:hypothetical protein
MIKKGHLTGGVNGEASPRKDGKTPLMLATEAEQFDVVDYLLEHGADPWMKDAAGETAVDLARQEKVDDIAGKLTEYEKDHLAPGDYYAAHQPALFILSGSNQVGAPDCGGPQSMVVYAMDRVSPDSPTLLLRTDANGICKANLHLPRTPNTSIRIDVTAGAGADESQVFFTARSNDGKSGGTNSCFNPTDEKAVVNPDNTVTVTWKNNTDDETLIRIWVDTPVGMRAVLSVPAHSTTARLPLQ